MQADLTSPVPPASNAPLDAVLEELLARRRELEARLHELRAVVTELAGTTLPPAASTALSNADSTLRRFDADLSALAASTHAIFAALRQRGLAGDSVQQVLFVGCGTQTFAVPLEQIAEIRAPRDIGAIALTPLTALVGLPAQPSAEERVLRVGQHGIAVPQLLRQDEVVVRPLGPYFADFPLFTGAALTADGLVLVLDLREAS
jgi:hypothetical protein